MNKFIVELRRLGTPLVKKAEKIEKLGNKRVG
jgi:hypothetical protein